MAQSNDNSLISADAGGIERTLGSPSFQRIYARCASIVGVLLLIGIFIAWTTMPTLSFDPRFSWSSIAGVMKIFAGMMLLLLVLTAILLASYISLRDSRRPLARHLASFSSSIALFTVPMCIPFFFGSTFSSPLKQITSSGNLWFSFLAPIFFLLVASLVLSVWMFSLVKFMFYFPKPVKLAGLDPETANQSLGQRWRNRSALKFWYGDFDWRGCMSPQFAALVAGIVMISLVDYQAGQSVPEAIFDHVTPYWWCWLPFAFISGKYKHVGDEDRPAIRWVTVGQSVWLTVFIFLLALVFITRATGLLEFSNAAESTNFVRDLMIFLFAGFIAVFLATLAFSMFYHGTLDPDLVLRRTWVVALVSVISGMLFVSIERFAAGVLTRWLAITSATAFTLVGVFTAICVFPLRTWAERMIKRASERWHSSYVLADGVREEAVIVFADLSGYTALTERNEREALILAAIFHRDADRVAESFRGRLIKTIGDAVMMRFALVDDACAATKKLIEDYTIHAESLVSAPLPIHAAIHLGEVVEGANGDVFGATVNLAARLLGAAGPHEVVASKAALDKLTEKAQAEAMGSRTFKNVENPVVCFRLISA